MLGTPQQARLPTFFFNQLTRGQPQVFSHMTRLLRKLLLRTPSKANYKFVLKQLRPLLELPQAAKVLETKRFSSLLQPVAMARPEGSRLLVIAPHPDDELFGPGGTLLTALRAGAAAEVVYLTNGIAGQRGVILASEARAVCDAWQVRPSFMSYAPGHIPREDPRFNELLARFTPDTVFIPFLLDDHDDHRRASELLACAIKTTGLRFEVWAYQVYTSVPVNVVVDITSVIDEKIAQIETYKHVSGERDWGHYARGMAAANCRYIASREPVYGETFFVVPSYEYVEICEEYFDNPAHVVYQGKQYAEMDS